jgi:drug/metabolite transporter superfamily protein YnfA
MLLNVTSQARGAVVGKFNLTPVAWLVFIAAAALEVGGDAIIRKGLRDRGWTWIVGGCLTLAAYGLIVNLVKWDFARLLGVYVGVFALFAVLCGRFALKEDVSMTTWAGLGIILVGGAVIQIGSR